MKKRIAAPLVAALLVFGTQPAWGYGYGHAYGHGHGGYGHYYGHGGYGHYYGHGGYGHGGYGYRYGYGHGQHYYYGGGGLLYGLLSIPAQVVDAVVGYPRYPGGNGYSSMTYGSPVYIERGAGSVTPDEHGGYGGGSAPLAGRQDNANGRPSTNSGSADSMRGPGWDVLAAGNYSGALANFAVEAESNPTRGVPKVGYALSAAAGGDLGRGVWAMRRAFGIDPRSVEYVVIDDRLRSQVEQLASRYQQPLASGGSNPDSAFMVASLRYLLSDVEAARNSIEQALQGGDRSDSARNLKQLIDQRAGQRGSGATLDMQPAPGASASSDASFHSKQ